MALCPHPDHHHVVLLGALQSSVLHLLPILMRRFGKNIVWTTLMLVIWAIGMNSIQVQKMKDSVPDDKSILVLGDSHSTGFQGANLLNLSIPGEPFPIQVGKALVALEQDEFDTAIFAIGPQTASSEPLRLMNNERNWLAGNQGKVSLVVFSELQLLTLLSGKSILYIALNAFNWSKKTSIPGDFNDHGPESDLSEKRTKERLHQHDVLRPNWYCDDRRFNKALSMLVEACKSRDTQLYLIETPYHKSYRDQVHPQGYKAFRSDILRFCNLHDDVQYIDFSKAPYPDHYFNDADHLNASGFRHFMEVDFQQLND